MYMPKIDLSNNNLDSTSGICHNTFQLDTDNQNNYYKIGKGFNIHQTNPTTNYIIIIEAITFLKCN